MTFKRILIPTDGSELSERAIAAGVDLAKRLGAQVTGFHVVPEYHAFTLQPALLEQSADGFTQTSAARAEAALKVVRESALAAGVDFDLQSTSADAPYLAILYAAKRHACDLIVMASHGRHGVKGMLLGSETSKVLTHGDLPVLVIQ